MLINIRAVQEITGIPIQSIRRGLAGLAEHRTKGRHRRYDIEEVLELKKRMDRAGIDGVAYYKKNVK